MHRDFKYVLPSLILASSIFLMIYGYQIGIYLLMAFMSINAISMVISAAVLLNLDVISSELPFHYRNPLLQFMMHILSFLALYQAYLLGYIFFSGFMTFMVCISLVSNFLYVLGSTI